MQTGLTKLEPGRCTRQTHGHSQLTTPNRQCIKWIKHAMVKGTVEFPTARLEAEAWRIGIQHALGNGSAISKTTAKPSKEIPCFRASFRELKTLGFFHWRLDTALVAAVPLACGTALGGSTLGRIVVKILAWLRFSRTKFWLEGRVGQIPIGFHGPPGWLESACRRPTDGSDRPSVDLRPAAGRQRPEPKIVVFPAKLVKS